jgi:hypothetical protein
VSDPTRWDRESVRRRGRDAAAVSAIAEEADLKRATLRKAADARRRADDAVAAATARRQAVSRAAAARAGDAERKVKRAALAARRTAVRPKVETDGPADPLPVRGTLSPVAATAGAGLLVGVLFGWRLGRR